MARSLEALRHFLVQALGVLAEAAVGMLAETVGCLLLALGTAG